MDPVIEKSVPEDAKLEEKVPMLNTETELLLKTFSSDAVIIVVVYCGTLNSGTKIQATKTITRRNIINSLK